MVKKSLVLSFPIYQHFAIFDIFHWVFFSHDIQMTSVIIMLGESLENLLGWRWRLHCVLMSF